MFGWLFGKKAEAKAPASMTPAQALKLRAQWDAAQTTTNNQNAWQYADNLDAQAAGNEQVRRDLRSRSRYEYQENNSYGKGLVLALANFTIGRGPRLELNIPGTDDDRFIETEFNRWLKATGMPEKLRTSRMSKAVDGEVFLWERTNKRLRSRVQLDYILVEADQCATPDQDEDFFDPLQTDGIVFDRNGYPLTYHFLKSHPGSDTIQLIEEFDSVPADQVIHLFRQDRPGQRRGIPETAPALPLSPILRRYTLATLEAATSAAYWMAVIHSRMPADQDPAKIEDDPFSVFDLERNAVMNLPEGWDISQLKPEHPTTQYQMFKKEILEEQARCLEVPFNIASGNSAGYNFASGRLDWQGFFRTVEVERNYYERVCLDIMFEKWLDEAMLIEGYLPDIPQMQDVPHIWHWDKFPAIDPKSEAQATKMLWEIDMLDEEDYWSERGKSAEEVHERMGRNKEDREDNNLLTPESSNNGDSDEETEQEEDETPSTNFRQQPAT